MKFRIENIVFDGYESEMGNISRDGWTLFSTQWIIAKPSSYLLTVWQKKDEYHKGVLPRQRDISDTRTDTTEER